MKYTIKNNVPTIPDVLAEFLFGVAAQNEEDETVFVLTPRRLGGNDVQDILVYMAGHSSVRTVFGYQPADAAVKLCRRSIGYTMSVDTNE